MCHLNAANYVVDYTSININNRKNIRIFFIEHNKHV